MITDTLLRLRSLCDTVPSLLAGLTETEWTTPTAPGKWNKKQILGHLIDSAANNHQRFVRGQFEDVPVIAYAADDWAAAGFHAVVPAGELIRFWEAYNRYLLVLLPQLQEATLLRQVCTQPGGCSGANAPTLAFLVEDYVAHLEHHLAQLLPLQN